MKAISTGKPLTSKQQLFVDEYMKDRNATQAAIRAGYSAKTARQMGAENLSKPAIAAEIAKRTAEYTRAAGLEVVAILEEAKKIAFSDISGAFDAQTGALLPIHKMSERMCAAIASIKVTEIAGGLSVDRDGNGQYSPLYTKEVKLWDKPAAIFKLLDFIKSVPASTPNNVTNNVRVDTDKLMLALHVPLSPP